MNRLPLFFLFLFLLSFFLPLFLSLHKIARCASRTTIAPFFDETRSWKRCRFIFKRSPLPPHHIQTSICLIRFSSRTDFRFSKLSIAIRLDYFSNGRTVRHAAACIHCVRLADARRRTRYINDIVERRASYVDLRDIRESRSRSKTVPWEKFVSKVAAVCRAKKERNEAGNALKSTLPLFLGKS